MRCIRPQLAFRHTSPVLVAATLALVGVGVASTASGGEPALLGVRTGASSDTGAPLAGFELLIPLFDRLYLNPNVEHVFDNDARQDSASLDLRFDLERRGGLVLWSGCGATVRQLQSDEEGDAELDVALNLLFGVGLRTRTNLSPYLQGKMVLANRQPAISLAGGVRF